MVKKIGKILIHYFLQVYPKLLVLLKKNSTFSGPFKDIGYAVQRTNPGEYFHWHIDSGSHQFSDRQLVAIWYLNNVDGPGGETEFLNQMLRLNQRLVN